LITYQEKKEPLVIVRSLSGFFNHFPLIVKSLRLIRPIRGPALIHGKCWRGVALEIKVFGMVNSHT
jgi:hypothetical protein